MRPNGGSLSPSWNPTIRPCTSAIKQALAAADSLLTYCRTSDQYPLTGKGDINTYAVFAELAYRLVAPHGRVGLLVPSGIASDMTTKDFFAAVAESNRLIRLFDFENKKTFFPEVHASSSSASSTLAANKRQPRKPISSSLLTGSKSWKTGIGTLPSAPPTSGC